MNENQKLVAIENMKDKNYDVFNSKGIQKMNFVFIELIHLN